MKEDREQREVEFVKEYIAKHFGSESEMMSGGYAGIIGFIYSAMEWAREDERRSFENSDHRRQRGRTAPGRISLGGEVQE